MVNIGGRHFGLVFNGPQSLSIRKKIVRPYTVEEPLFYLLFPNDRSLVIELLMDDDYNTDR